MKRLFLIPLVLVFMLGLILSGCAKPAPAPTPVPSPEPAIIEEGWVRLRIQDVGSIDYPSDFLELQSGDYKETKEEFFRVYDIPSSDFTLQQVGLNELKSSALKEFRRVLFRTDYLNSGEEVFRANEKYTMSQKELTEFQNELINQLLQGYAMQKSLGLGNNKIIDSGSLEIMEINGMFPLVHTYKRQLNDNSVVLVKAYLFWNYDKMHSLAFSCRVVDEEECRDIYDKILDSFRLQ